MSPPRRRNLAAHIPIGRRSALPHRVIKMIHVVRCRDPCAIGQECEDKRAFERAESISKAATRRVRREQVAPLVRLVQTPSLKLEDMRSECSVSLSVSLRRPTEEW